jgi:FecR protein
MRKKQMKHCKLFMILAFLLITPFPATASAAPIEEAVIESASGPVNIKAGDESSRPAKPDTYVLSGEIVETGPDSFVRLIMSDGSVLELRENSSMEMADSRGNESAINTVVLFLGVLWASIEANDDEDTAFIVDTPTAVAGVRGTRFMVGVGIDGATRVGVEEGLVIVSSEAGIVDVEGGKDTIVEWNKPPRLPRRYQRDEDEWRGWIQGRRQALVNHGDSIVPWVINDVAQQRKELMAMKSERQKKTEAWKKYRDENGLQRKKIKLTRKRKKIIVKKMDALYVVTRDLHKADKKMIAKYRLIENIEQDIKNNPDLYDEEFKKTISDAKTKLDALNVKGIHEENRKIVELNAEKLQETAKRLGVQKQLKKKVIKDRKKDLQNARKHFKETHKK